MTITVSDLTKSYAVAGTPAVDHVSFAAPAGRITALLGPSGAGKSTVLRLLAGLEWPDQGTIIINGVDCTALPAQKRNIGLVFQNYALFEHMNVRANIAFGLKVRKRVQAEIDQRVDELLGLMKLDLFADRFPGQLSGGQKQRVAFARALAIEPRLLLLDEPFAALDVRVRQELRDWLHDLHTRTGITTIIVTHDQDEAFELASHVVVMFGGRVAQAGTPHEIYDHPATPQLAAFLGGANVLTGRIANGRAELGSMDVQAPDHTADGALFHAVVRPHEVTLSRFVDEAPRMSMATIERLRRVGGFVKVTLLLQSGERVTVERPLSDVEALGAVEGDRVIVDLRKAKLFVGDYTI